jgi:hypothetical protein|tara:strand:- start:270 stop:1097 length:828 start_codon:yes stop_codon:yes gene_type:complete
MGFSGGLGPGGFNNAIGAGGIDMPAYKRQSSRSNVPRARELTMWFMAAANEKARVCDVSAGGGVNRVRDFSGKRNHLIQIVPAKKPTVKQGATGGKASFNFATANWLYGTNATAFDTGTGAFDIYMILNLTAGSANQGIMGTKTGTAASAAGISLIATSVEKLRGLGSNGSAQKATALTGDNYDDKGYFMVRFFRTGTTTSIFTLSSDGTTQTINVADAGIDYSGGRMAIGAFNGGGVGFAGDIAEMLAYKGIRLSAGDKNKVQGYLNTKYKLGI